MTYLVLARKYRPQTLRQIVGQDHVTLTIANAILKERIPHSILFSGPRGIGKTTVARILAKAINCEADLKKRPCNKCKSCTDITVGKGADVFEIDGASNNSVDQVRTLQENIRYMPAVSRAKIYIIDEVHMLSGAAFNALLKTLEEPPKHIVFILATTEHHKIPTTITSRCQHHNLRRIETKTIQRHLTYICKVESFKITHEDLWAISNKSDGSVRDALSLLDQIMSCCGNHAQHDQIINILGILDRDLIHDIAEAVFLKDTMTVLNKINYVYNQGHDLKIFYNNILEHFRHLLVLKIGGDAEKLIDLPSNEVDNMQKQIANINTTYIDQILSMLFREEVYVKNSNYVKLAFEIAFLKLHNIQPALSIDTLIEKLDNLSTLGLKNNTINKERILDKDFTRLNGKKDNIKNKKLKLLEHISNKKTAFGQNIDINKTWQQVQNSISKSKPSLAVNLAESSISKLNDSCFEIKVSKNEYTLKTLEKNLDLIKRTLQKHLGVTIKVVLVNNIKNHTNDPSIQDESNKMHTDILNHPVVADAMKIFNGKIEDVKINSNKKEK